MTVTYNFDAEYMMTEHNEIDDVYLQLKQPANIVNEFLEVLKRVAKLEDKELKISSNQVYRNLFNSIDGLQNKNFKKVQSANVPIYGRKYTKEELKSMENVEGSIVNHLKSI